MLVEAEVAEALRNRGIEVASIFVASCSERMVQVFSGLQGGEDSRDADLDCAISLVESLWDPDASLEVFSRAASALEEFPEMQPTETGLTGIVEVYSFYAVLTMRYAALCRANGDVESALKCAHACLTAMGQLDQNLPTPSFFAEEAELQRQIALSGIGEPFDRGCMRAVDVRVSAGRLVALRGRMG
ncbi:hypothetical protein ACWGA0_26540 [Streptomyces erythrochromogenes]|uniref:hypothetical protein n=1 Tax=Streptomyces erythrochromogenes TaxID=285574 RepID=UPI00131CBC2C|nr:hypothetical protein [Streptomyces erythrochromogenes]